MASLFSYNRGYRLLREETLLAQGFFLLLVIWVVLLAVEARLGYYFKDFHLDESNILILARWHCWREGTHE